MNNKKNTFEMVSKFVLGITLFLTSFSMISQELLLMSKDSSFMKSKSFVNVYGSGDWQSNSLTNLFADRMLFGGEIDGPLKDMVRENLQVLNRVGGEVSGGLTYYSFRDTFLNHSNWGMKVALEQKIDGFMSFSDDLFRLSFYGNTPYLGENLDFTNTRLGYISYQKIGFGVFNKRNFSGFTISLVNGNSFANTDIRSGGLYSSATGDTLEFNASGTAIYSNPNSNLLTDNNGLGVALDFVANIPLKDNGGYISFEMSDLGFIQWDNQTITNVVDTSIVFTGIDLNDFLDNNESTNLPELDSTLYSTETGAVYTWLPTTVKVSLLKRIKENDYFELGINVKANKTYYPQLFAGYNYFMNDNTIVGLKASYGGYGNFRVGASIQKMWKGWFFTLATDNVPGLILKDAKGQGAAFSIGKFFGKHDK